MSELRECPFCGSGASLLSSAVSVVRCSNNFCALESPHYANDDRDKLIRWWNTRPASRVEIIAAAIEVARYDLHTPRMKRLRAALEAYGVDAGQAAINWRDASSDQREVGSGATDESPAAVADQGRMVGANREGGRVPVADGAVSTRASRVETAATKFLLCVEQYHDAIKLRDDLENRHLWSRELSAMYDAMVKLRAALAPEGGRG